MQRLTVACLVIFIGLVSVDLSKSQQQQPKECAKAGVNLFSSNETIKFYVQSVKLLQQSITVSIDNLNLLQQGSGGLNLQKLLSTEHYTLQLRFKSPVTICCFYINRQITNTREFEVRLLDSVAAETNKSSSQGKYTSDADLIIDMRALKPQAFGFELTVKRTYPTNEIANNLELSAILCDSSSSSNRPTASPLRDSVLDGACVKDEQCEKLINGQAKCINGSCKCVKGQSLNEYQCSVSASNLNEKAFNGGQTNMNVLNRLKNRTMSFVELSKVNCKQDRDCQTSFRDAQMTCINQKCVCTFGYRLFQANNSLVCRKASSAAVIRMPQMCNMPYCDLRLTLLQFKDPMSGQLYLTLNLVTDHYYYLNEYFQLLVQNTNRLKFFIDKDDRMRLLLDGRFQTLFRALANESGFHLNKTNPVRARKLRYVIQKIDNSTINKENLDESIVKYDLDEYKYLSSFIWYSFYSTGNLTHYNIDFNLNYSRLLLDSLMSGNEGANITCLNVSLIKGNFVQMNSEPDNPSRMAFFFDNKWLVRLNDIRLCLNKTSLSNGKNITCQNGILAHDVKYPKGNSTLDYCMCTAGYMGSKCEKINPCYTFVNNSKYVNDSIVLASTFCQNDGLCIAAKSSLSYFIRTGNNYIPKCLCKPQYGGKSCEKNLDSCSFPFIYDGKYHIKCIVDASSRQPWCAKGTRNLDEKPSMYGSCQNIPCKTPWRLKSNIYFDKCVFKRYKDEKGYYEKPYCSLTRNLDLFNSWRFCEINDL